MRARTIHADPTERQRRAICVDRLRFPSLLAILLPHGALMGYCRTEPFRVQCSGVSTKCRHFAYTLTTPTPPFPRFCPVKRVG